MTVFLLNGECLCVGPFAGERACLCELLQEVRRFLQIPCRLQSLFQGERTVCEFRGDYFETLKNTRLRDALWPPNSQEELDEHEQTDMRLHFNENYHVSRTVNCEHWLESSNNANDLKARRAGMSDDTSFGRTFRAPEDALFCELTLVTKDYAVADLQSLYVELLEAILVESRPDRRDKIREMLMEGAPTHYEDLARSKTVLSLQEREQYAQAQKVMEAGRPCLQGGAEAKGDSDARGSYFGIYLKDAFPEHLEIFETMSAEIGHESKPSSKSVGPPWMMARPPSSLFGRGEVLFVDRNSAAEAPAIAVRLARELGFVCPPENSELGLMIGSDAGFAVAPRFAPQAVRNPDIHAVKAAALSRGLRELPDCSGGSAPAGTSPGANGVVGRVVLGGRNVLIGRPAALSVDQPSNPFPPNPFKDEVMGERASGEERDTIGDAVGDAIEDAMGDVADDSICSSSYSSADFQSALNSGFESFDSGQEQEEMQFSDQFMSIADAKRFRFMARPLDVVTDIADIEIRNESPKRDTQKDNKADAPQGRNSSISSRDGADDVKEDAQPAKKSKNKRRRRAAAAEAATAEKEAKNEGKKNSKKDSEETNPQAAAWNNALVANDYFSQRTIENLQRRRDLDNHACATTKLPLQGLTPMALAHALGDQETLELLRSAMRAMRRDGAARRRCDAALMAERDPLVHNLSERALAGKKRELLMSAAGPALVWNPATGDARWLSQRHLARAVEDGSSAGAQPDAGGRYTVAARFLRSALAEPKSSESGGAGSAGASVRKARMSSSSLLECLEDRFSRSLLLKRVGVDVDGYSLLKRAEDELLDDTIHLVMLDEVRWAWITKCWPLLFRFFAAHNICFCDFGGSRASEVASDVSQPVRRASQAASQASSGMRRASSSASSASAISSSSSSCSMDAPRDSHGSASRSHASSSAVDSRCARESEKRDALLRSLQIPPSTHLESDKKVYVPAACAIGDVPCHMDDGTNVNRFRFLPSPYLRDAIRGNVGLDQLVAAAAPVGAPAGHGNAGHGGGSKSYDELVRHERDVAKFRKQHGGRDVCLRLIPMRAVANMRLRRGEGVEASEMGNPLHACAALSVTFPDCAYLLAQTLLGRGCDLDGKDSEGDSPLAHARFFNSERIYNLFRRKGGRLLGNYFT